MDKAKNSHGLTVGDRWSGPIGDAIPGAAADPDAPSVEYVVTAVDADRFSLSAPDPDAEHHRNARRPGHRPPPVPPWARHRGRR
jgi:hypothetical protein